MNEQHCRGFVALSESTRTPANALFPPYPPVERIIASVTWGIGDRKSVCRTAHFLRKVCA